MALSTKQVALLGAHFLFLLAISCMLQSLTPTTQVVNIHTRKNMFINGCFNRFLLFLLRLYSRTSGQQNIAAREAGVCIPARQQTVISLALLDHWVWRGCKVEFCALAQGATLPAVSGSIGLQDVIQAISQSTSKKSSCIRKYSTRGLPGGHRCKRQGNTVPLSPLLQSQDVSWLDVSGEFRVGTQLFRTSTAN